jgi:hypothetical protein
VGRAGREWREWRVAGGGWPGLGGAGAGAGSAWGGDAVVAGASKGAGLCHCATLRLLYLPAPPGVDRHEMTTDVYL